MIIGNLLFLSNGLSSKALLHKMPTRVIRTDVIAELAATPPVSASLIYLCVVCSVPSVPRYIAGTLLYLTASLLP